MGGMEDGAVKEKSSSRRIGEAVDVTLVEQEGTMIPFL